MESNTAGERRPLKTRQKGWALKMAFWLAARGVTPNQISLFSILCGIVACVAFVATSYVPQMLYIDLLYVIAIIGIQSRLLCNLLDGMVAVEARHGVGKCGEIFNDLPDRITDIFIFIGAGISAGGRYGLIVGMSAAIAAVMTAYIRVLGKSIGAKAHFAGPAAKQHRMFILTMTCIACAVLVWFDDNYRRWVMLGSLVLITIGCVATCINRLLLIRRDLRVSP